MTLHEVRERTSSQLRVLLKQNEGCVWVSDQPSIQEDKQRWTRIVGRKGDGTRRYRDPRKEGCNLQDG
jgi:hypothetical protein